MVNTLLVKSYALNVYKTGRNSLSNIALTRPDYVIPVMQYVADAYFIEDIDDALTETWITLQEHDDTLALKGEEDPQHRPIVEFMIVKETTPTV